MPTTDPQQPPTRTPGIAGASDRASDENAGAVVRALRHVVAADRVLTDEDSLEKYSHDDAEWAAAEHPIAVVLPESIDDVVAAVGIARTMAVHIVPRGSGTGLSGGANATAQSIVLSLERMTRVLEIDPAERVVVAQAGVLNDDLRAAVAEHGLWYPPDPASSAISTIGGNAATNAGGICCVKYGVTRDYVLGMTVVLADGSVVKLGRRTAKGVVGYDLTHLMVGSEGTLGVIVDVTLRLLPLAGREDRAVVGSFASLQEAGAAVAAIAAAGIIPAALEIIDSTCLNAVESWQHLGLHGVVDSSGDDAVPVDTMLLAKLDEPGAVGDGLSARVVDLMLDAGAVRVESAIEPDEVARLFLARRLAYPALERLGPVLTEDICVPRAAVPQMLARIQAIAASAGVTIANIAHAGDGNLHPLIIAPDGDDEAKVRAKGAFDRIVEECLALGGTVTGEHGVGLLKLPGAAAELGDRVIAMHRAIKGALDPNGTLNPGKAFPTVVK